MKVMHKLLGGCAALEDLIQAACPHQRCVKILSSLSVVDAAINKLLAVGCIDFLFAKFEHVAI